MIDAPGASYTLPEIQQFYATEYPTLHGTSPDVYAQNVAMLERAQRFAGSNMSDAILGVQLMGSRAQGSAGVNSDVDSCVVYLGAPHNREVDAYEQGLYNAIQPLTKDSWGAIAWHGLRPLFPIDPPAFQKRVSSAVETMTPLFEPGMYSTPAFKLCMAAVSLIIANSGERDALWRQLREQHIDDYVAASRGRVAAKIARRIRSKLSSNVIISPELLQARIDRFSLPKQFDEFYQPLEQWAKANADALAGTPAHNLYVSARRPH